MSSFAVICGYSCLRPLLNSKKCFLLITKVRSLILIESCPVYYACFNHRQYRGMLFYGFSNCESMRKLSFIGGLQPPTYIKCLSSQQLSTKADEIQIILMEYLNINKAQAMSIIQQHNLNSLKAENLESILKFLLQNRVSVEQIKSNGWIFQLSLNAIRQKMKLMKKHKNSDHYLILLKVPLKSLQVLVRWDSGVPDRLAYLSENLGISVTDLMKWLDSRCLEILRIDFHKIKNIMEMLKNANVANEAICNDLWIFKHNEELISKRLLELKPTNVPIKPWMLRCSEETYRSYFNRQQVSQAVLHPHKSTPEYLADRLECSVGYIKYVAQRNPAILSINPPKLKEVLDFLLEKGFTCQEILHSSRILCYSLETLQNRLAELEALDVRPLSLLSLCKSKKGYERWIETLMFRKRKKDGV